MGRKVVRGGCIGVGVMTLIMLVGIALAVYFMLAASAPELVPNVFSEGLARKDSTFGAAGTGPGRFQEPIDVAVDGEGHIYVLDYAILRVQRFAPDGRYMSGWTVEGKNPVALAASRDGLVYVAVEGRIHKYDGPSGAFLGAFETDMIFGYNDVALFPNGDLLTFVGGTAGDLVRLDSQGNEVGRYEDIFSGTPADSVPAPWLVRVAADGLGNIFVLNQTGQASVYAYSPDGNYLDRFRAGPAGENLAFTNGLAVDGKSRVYVGTSAGIHVFSQDGTYLGKIEMPFPYIPDGIAFNDANELFVVSRHVDEVTKFVLNDP
jgi:outer membrane protein assembly factor BamB